MGTCFRLIAQVMLACCLASCRMLIEHQLDRAMGGTGRDDVTPIFNRAHDVLQQRCAGAADRAACLNSQPDFVVVRYHGRRYKVYPNQRSLFDCRRDRVQCD
ncbi:MAG: hypothetical protein Q3966_08670 [Neisseria sp.]|nr:hypothetical protein [Neisseria sp.]